MAHYQTGHKMKIFSILRESFEVAVPPANTSIEVADIQKVLLALGYTLPKHGVDGIRGPETIAAIKRFQGDAGIQPSGAADQKTIDYLNATLNANPTVGDKLVKSTAADIKVNSYANVDTTTIQDPDFQKKLEKVAKELGITSKSLLGIMKKESGVNPQARNPYSNATGLIQFMPKTAVALGTTVEDLYNMSAVEQLDYVYKYYKVNGVGDGSIGDLYMATFMPKYVGYPDDTVLGQSGADGFAGLVYDQNKVLDVNGDGAITVGDVKQSVQRYA